LSRGPGATYQEGLGMMSPQRWALALAKALCAVIVYAAVLVLGFKLGTGALRAPPSGVRRAILIRHGEKEGHKGAWGNGLSHAGKMRAECLAGRFADIGVTNLFAFVNKPTTRPVDTLRPLATELGIPIDTQFKRGQLSKLAEYILWLPPSNLSIVCWEHDRLHKIAEHLGVAKHDIPDDLKHFPSDSWDKLWSIYYDDTSSGKSANIREELEHCTYGSNYYEVYYWYWGIGVGIPVALILGVILLRCLAEVCCRGNDRETSQPQRDHAEEPLLDDTQQGL